MMERPVVCPKCGQRFNDDNVSWVCPHRGILGLCIVCDQYICCCPAGTKNPRSNKYDDSASAD